MPLHCLKLFAVTLAILLALTAAIRHSSWMEALPLPIASSSPPPSEDYFLTTDNTATLDQLVFQHRLRDVASSARQADILFVGNSRSLFALPERHCEPAFRESGLRYFHLGLPMETCLFTQHLIEEFELRPRWVVADADGFFDRRISAMARRSLETASFNARTTYWEACVSREVRSRLHTVMPHLPTMFFAAESMIVFRSAANGTWFVAAGHGHPSRVHESVLSDHDQRQVAASRPARLQAAREFQSFIEQRGGTLVLTYVPSRIDRRAEAAWLASELGCRLISPEVSGLTTLDGSHLDGNSVDRFAPSLLRELTSHVRTHELVTVAFDDEQHR